ncbi:MAG: heavy metal-responsive transcriptional regulator [Actinomycetota bacterium]|nr:heavy metal-responsive transcriptional regulator [Actinomycetota bacterium]
MDGLTISKLAGQVGTSADSLRYYERIGLLPEPERSPSGYRLYGPEAIERVRFIKRAQGFGLRLDDIAGLIDVRERGMCPCGGTRRLLEARLAQLDEEMASLARLRDDIRTMLDEAPIDGPATQSSCGPDCGTGLLQIGRQGPTTAAESTGREVHETINQRKEAGP